MDWTRELDITDGVMYAGPRWLGSFSSHAAALAGLRLMRGDDGLVVGDCTALTADDLDLLEAIDADEE